MPNKISSAPSPRTFAEALKNEVLEPAAQKVAGDDGVIDATEAAAASSTLDGAEQLAAEMLQDAATLTGTGAPTVAAFVEAAVARTEAAAAAATGGDGRISQADAEGLPDDLRMAFHYLRSGELPAAGGPTDVGALPSAPGVRYSENVFRSVMEAYGLTDPQALFDKTLSLEDGNHYLKTAEFEAAAQALIADSVGDPMAGYDFSDNVVDAVMDEFGIFDRALLLSTAKGHDADGNKYLKTSELQAAAKALTGQLVELGIISDIDKTVLPKVPYDSDAPYPAPFPGIAQLLQELELGANGAPGDLEFVTARPSHRVSMMPAWFEEHGIPDGPISTGVDTPMPWLARPEKVADISAIFDANPEQKFVLFGDSSHADPEVYNDVLEKYPDRVHAVFIHKVNNVNPARVENHVLVEHYGQAAAHLLSIGLLDETQARRVMIAVQAGGIDLTDAQIDALIDENRP